MEQIEVLTSIVHAISELFHLIVGVTCDVIINNIIYSGLQRAAVAGVGFHNSTHRTFLSLYFVHCIINLFIIHYYYYYNIHHFIASQFEGSDCRCVCACAGLY